MANRELWVTLAVMLGAMLIILPVMGVELPSISDLTGSITKNEYDCSSQIANPITFQDSRIDWVKCQKVGTCTDLKPYSIFDRLNPVNYIKDQLVSLTSDEVLLEIRSSDDSVSSESFNVFENSEKVITIQGLCTDQSSARAYLYNDKQQTISTYEVTLP